ncbi:hypothetical protein GCM10007094_27880 [Pseudovibrio japonicus]|uniref:DUF3054 domain-containing protein n=1 Tax=Pseudovibrio japonicus TaxID=366534 RepID=A0ABQ3ELE2_9HYPH|nr:hypothetical protein [Pseudovibrio japonicus]GHB36676.1 hypothetical protein GCM10007094_27880 [Pseudovibrio japonicus]
MSDRFIKQEVGFTIETFFATAFYVAACALRAVYADSLGAQFLQVGASLLPSIAALLIGWVFIRFFRRSDERDRQAMMLGSTWTLFVAIVSLMILVNWPQVWPINYSLFAAFLLVRWSVLVTIFRKRV